MTNQVNYIMLRKILLLITGILLVLVTGVFWGTWFSMSRTMYTLPPEIFIVIGKQIMKNVAVGMSIMMPLGIWGVLSYQPHLSLPRRYGLLLDGGH